MNKIVPSLWFDDNCEEAMEFYAAVFPDSQITQVMRYPENAQDEHLQGMDGKVLHGEFSLNGYDFGALDGGPTFQLNRSISFLVHFDPNQEDQAADKLQALWDALIDDGEAHIELGEHPFSKKYGWLKDKFGVTWQLILMNQGDEPRPFIMPDLLFNGPRANQANAAIDFYMSVFKDGRVAQNVPYPEDSGLAKKGSVMYADFAVAGGWFAVMDAPVDMDVPFNEAVSFIINCQDQTEIDYFWGKLSAVPESEQCGWLKDKFGVSWQVIPANIGDLIKSPAALDAMMKMKKIDITALREAA